MFSLNVFSKQWFDWFDSVKAAQDLGKFAKGGGNGCWLFILCLIWWSESIDCIKDDDERREQELKSLCLASESLSEVFESLLAVSDLSSLREKE